LDEIEAFFAEYAGGDVAAVVERWVGFEQVDPAASRWNRDFSSKAF
jgi:hypothetical protein